MLDQILLSIDSLFLDPNNPRFICNLSQPAIVPDVDVEALQESMLARFGRKATSEAEDFEVTNIKDLYESMRQIGFQGSDKIVVRKLAGISGKYLVIEGNRRVAAVRSVLRDYDGKRSPLDNPDNRKRVKSHEGSLREITVKCLNYDGLSEDQYSQKISVLLGLRHHGSLLEWEPLPRAFHIFTEYMRESPVQETFVYVHNNAQDVADRLCVEIWVVKKALKTYQAYNQARKRFPDVKADHYSLIEAGVQDRHLSVGYFNIDTSTFLLDEMSLTKLNTVCQFSTRDSGDPGGTTVGLKKICPEPRQFSLLGKLIDRMQRANHPAIKAFAADLIRRAEDEQDFQMTLEQAVNELTAFENRTKWAEVVGKLLDKQAEELKVEGYMGEGTDRGRKDELVFTLQYLRKMVDV